jgi:hypothetical protein
MDCPDCSLDRRSFLKSTLAGTAAVATGLAAPAKRAAQNEPETLVTTLYRSLTPDQKQLVCFPFDHPLRSKVDNNWFITPQRIAQFYNADQQAMITEIFRGLHNPQFVDKVMHHIEEDAGGLGKYSVALFGEPGGGKFEFVLAGRHCTARCDGDSVEGAAFGGPIFYGHQAGPNATENPGHPNNVYWYQAQRANEVFHALSGKQREQALLGDSREEKGTSTIELKKDSRREGLPVADMTRDQRELVEKVLADLLMPFRQRDAEEAMRLIKSNGGAASLNMAFFKNEDLGGDGVWDVWQLEGPKMVWYFRGTPHVHVWVNVQA